MLTILHVLVNENDILYQDTLHTFYNFPRADHLKRWQERDQTAPALNAHFLSQSFVHDIEVRSRVYEGGQGVDLSARVQPCLA